MSRVHPHLVSAAVAVALLAWVVPVAVYAVRTTAAAAAEPTPSALMYAWMAGSDPVKRWGGLLLVVGHYWYLLVAVALAVRLLNGRAPIVIRRIAEEFSDA